MRGKAAKLARETLTEQAVEPTELDLLEEEQADELEDEARTSVRRKNVPRRKPKPESAPMRPWVTKPPTKRQWAKKSAPPRPAWMSDPTLLPKRPPGR